MDESRARGWQRIDKSAFGIIYGGITVLSILMASEKYPGTPFETAAVLFGSVLAITLAKTFAEFLSEALETGERPTRDGWRKAWRHSAPTLAAANLPTLMFILGGLGWLTPETALLAAQGICVGLMALVGGRIGWVIDRKISRSLLGAVFSGGVAIVLAGLKHLL